MEGERERERKVTGGGSSLQGKLIISPSPLTSPSNSKKTW